MRIEWNIIISKLHFSCSVIVGQKLLKACVVLLLKCRLKINIYHLISSTDSFSCQQFSIVTLILYKIPSIKTKIWNALIKQLIGGSNGKRHELALKDSCALQCLNMKRLVFIVIIRVVRRQRRSSGCKHYLIADKDKAFEK